MLALRRMAVVRGQIQVIFTVARPFATYTCAKPSFAAGRSTASLVCARNLFPLLLRVHRGARTVAQRMEANQLPALDYTISSAAPRSLFRRVLPWAASLGLFAGGGYGVYRYAAPHGAAAAAPQSPARASEDMRQLFDASQASAPTAYGDRYAAPPASSSPGFAAAPTLPPMSDDEEVATPRSAASVNSSASPLATTPVADDRYSAAGATTDPFRSAETAAKAMPAAAPNDLPTQDEPAAAVAEVTRGQEPDSSNPLRNSDASAAAPVDARAAFSEDPPRAPKPQVLDLTAKPRPSNGTPASGTAAASPTPVGSRYAAPAAAAAAPDFAAGLDDNLPNGADAPVRQAQAATTLNLAPQTPRVASIDASRQSSTAPTPAPTAMSQPSARQPAVTPLATGPAAASPMANERADDPSFTRTPGLAAADGTGRPGERILEGSQASALTIQKLAPPEIQVGKKCTFAIRVHNSSQRTVHNVQVRDEVPLGTQFVGASPRGSVDGTQVTWDLGTLSAGEERIVEMELMPTDEGELGSVATVTFAAQASAKAKCTRPQLAIRLSSQPRVMVGQQQLVEIEVSNPGSGDATGVVLLESVPQGVSHEAGPALEFEVGTLRPGESRRLELVLTAEQAGHIDNVMTAKADASLTATGNCEFEVIAPELKVTVEGPQRRYLERPATYTVNVDNPGTASAKDIQLITQLPKGMQFVSANNMGEYDAATHSVYWSLAELPANERGSVELTALPIEPGEQTLQVATRARQGLEDRTETHVTVEGLVALSFEVTAADGAIEVGGETSYEIRVTNQGSKAASNVQVVAIMPPGLKPMAGQGETRTVVDGNRVQFAPLAQLAPKAEAKFRVQVQGLRPGDQRTRVQITTDEVQEPITKEQSTRVYADE